MEIRWFMNKYFRLALLRNWQRWGTLRSARFEVAYRHGVEDEAASDAKVREETIVERLQDDVAERGGLDGAGADREAGGIRGGLVQVVVLTTADDDVETSDLPARQSHQAIQDHRAALRKRIEDQTGQPNLVIGRIDAATKPSIPESVASTGGLSAERGL